MALPACPAARGCTVGLGSRGGPRTPGEKRGHALARARAAPENAAPEIRNHGFQKFETMVFKNSGASCGPPAFEGSGFLRIWRGCVSYGALDEKQKLRGFSESFQRFPRGSFQMFFRGFSESPGWGVMGPRFEPPGHQFCSLVSNQLVPKEASTSQPKSTPRPTLFVSRAAWILCSRK